MEIDPMLQHLVGNLEREDWRVYARPAPVYADGPLPWEKAAVPDPFDVIRENGILKSFGVVAGDAALRKASEPEPLAKRGGTARERRAENLTAYKARLALLFPDEDLSGVTATIDEIIENGWKA